MPETTFERALDRATPGFDSRIAVLVNQADRIRQNRALAQEQAQKILEEEREFARRVAIEQAKSELSLNRGVQLEAFKHELRAPEREAQRRDKVVQSILETQDSISQRYGRAQQYGFVPRTTVSLDPESQLPIVEFLVEMTDESGQTMRDEDGKTRYQAMSMTMIDFNNNFAPMVDAADTLRRAEQVMNDTSVAELSDSTGIGRKQIKTLYDRVLGGDTSALADLNQALTNIRVQTTTEANRNSETLAAIRANYSGAVGLLFSKHLSEDFIGGRTRWGNKNIDPIDPYTMPINQVIAIAQRNSERTGIDREREYYSNMASHLNSLKTGLATLNFSDDPNIFDKVVLNRYWDSSQIKSDTNELRVEGDSVLATDYLNAMNDMFVLPGQMPIQATDGQTVGNYNPVREAAAPFWGATSN